VLPRITAEFNLPPLGNPGLFLANALWSAPHLAALNTSSETVYIEFASIWTVYTPSSPTLQVIFLSPRLYKHSSNK